MKCENELKIGDVVKSLDFVGIDNCYYVGLVMSISKMDGTFRAKTIKRVWLGKVDKKFPSDTFVAPMLGNSFFDDITNEKGYAPRIQVVA